jgi:hypothetical protein
VSPALSRGPRVARPAAALGIDTGFARYLSAWSFSHQPAPPGKTCEGPSRGSRRT